MSGVEGKRLAPAAPEDRACISWRALERAQHTIEARGVGRCHGRRRRSPCVHPSCAHPFNCTACMQDFVLTYFPLQSLAPLDFFKWWNVFVYVEGVIYQVDEDNEQATAAPLAAEQPGHARLEAMQQVLRERGLLTAGVQHELAAGQQYWHEERRLCGLMLQQPTVPAGGHGEACGFTLQEALRVSEAKSFDYRLLHLLLYALRRADPSPDDALLLRFLRVDELLVDIGDDLTDYEDDIDAGGGGGSFNILRAYVHLFGREAPLRLAERVGELERQREELLARLPPQQQQHVRQRQVQAADGGGGGLRWQLPPVILDEQAFRRQFAG